MGDNFCRKRDINDPEENTLFEVNAGESLLLWPKRRHVGVEDFPDDLKFYWLHFEVDARLPVLRARRRCRLSNTVACGSAICYCVIPSVFKRAGKLQRSQALEIILLLILQQISLSPGYEDKADDAGAAMAWKAKQLIRTHFHLPCPLHSWRKSCTATPIIWGEYFAGRFI